MAKIKLRHRTVVKRHQGDVYIFKNGEAVVPGMFVKGKPAVITLKEFKQITDDMYEEPL